MPVGGAFYRLATAGVRTVQKVYYKWGRAATPTV